MMMRKIVLTGHGGRCENEDERNSVQVFMFGSRREVGLYITS